MSTYYAGNMIRATFTWDRIDETVDVTTSTATAAVINLADGTIDPVTPTMTNTEAAVSAVVEWQIPDDSPTTRYIVAVDVSGPMEAYDEQSFYVIARADQETPTP